MADTVKHKGDAPCIGQLDVLKTRIFFPPLVYCVNGVASSRRWRRRDNRNKTEYSRMTALCRYGTLENF